MNSVQNFKSIRAKGGEVLREMSGELTKIGEREGTAERRKAVMEACKPVMECTEVSHSPSLHLIVVDHPPRLTTISF